MQYFQKGEVKLSVQTRVTIRDQAVPFWKVTVLADGKANLQAAEGLWHCLASETHLFSHLNSSEGEMQLSIKGF